MDVRQRLCKIFAMPLVHQAPVQLLAILAAVFKNFAPTTLLKHSWVWLWPSVHNAVGTLIKREVEKLRRDNFASSHTSLQVCPGNEASAKSSKDFENIILKITGPELLIFPQIYGLF